MSRFRNNVLKALDTIYRFPGGLRSPGEVDIERPVSVVHDVSTQAGGLVTAWISHVTALSSGGAGARQWVDRTAQDIYDLPQLQGRLSDLGLTPSNTDLWVIDINASVSSTTFADFVSATAAIRTPDEPRFFPSSTLEIRPIAEWDTVRQVDPDETSGRFPIYLSGVTIDHLRFAALPQPLGQLWYSALDDGTGATTVVYVATILVVPEGVRPIGLSRSF